MRLGAHAGGVSVGPPQGTGGCRPSAKPDPSPGPQAPFPARPGSALLSRPRPLGAVRAPPIERAHTGRILAQLPGRLSPRCPRLRSDLGSDHSWAWLSPSPHADWTTPTPTGDGDDSLALQLTRASSTFCLDGLNELYLLHLYSGDDQTHTRSWVKTSVTVS